MTPDITAAAAALLAALDARMPERDRARLVALIVTAEPRSGPTTAVQRLRAQLAALAQEARHD